MSSLAGEVRDFVAQYLFVAEVSVSGSTTEEFVEWLRPLLREDQDAVMVNGVSFDLYED